MCVGFSKGGRALSVGPGPSQGAEAPSIGPGPSRGAGAPSVGPGLSQGAGAPSVGPGPSRGAGADVGTKVPVVPFDLDLYHWSDHGNTSVDSHFVPVAQ